MATTNREMTFEIRQERVTRTGGLVTITEARCGRRAAHEIQDRFQTMKVGARSVQFSARVPAGVSDRDDYTDTIYSVVRVT